MVIYTYKVAKNSFPEHDFKRTYKKSVRWHFTIIIYNIVHCLYGNSFPK